MERALGLFLVVAWPIARPMGHGRTLPDLDAALLLDLDEWQVRYILADNPVRKTAPRLSAVLRVVAGLGGFLGRESDEESGVNTIWLRIQ